MKTNDGWMNFSRNWKMKYWSKQPLSADRTSSSIGNGNCLLPKRNFISVRRLPTLLLLWNRRYTGNWRNVIHSLSSLSLRRKRSLRNSLWRVNRMWWRNFTPVIKRKPPKRKQSAAWNRNWDEKPESIRQVSPSKTSWIWVSVKRNSCSTVFPTTNCIGYWNRLSGKTVWRCCTLISSICRSTLPGMKRLWTRCCRKHWCRRNRTTVGMSILSRFGNWST